MASSGEELIRKWRDQIDELDRQLVRLLNQRTECAIEIGKLKAEHEISIYDPEREGVVAKNVGSASLGPLTRQAVQRVFERIIDETRRSERESQFVTPSEDKVSESNSTLKGDKR